MAWADLTLRFDPARLEAAIGRVVREVLFQIGEATWTLDCDIVMLAGRPSKLPAIHTLLRGQLAVTPDRIVRMDRYPAGIWYPFGDRDNLTISDPKTTAVVGCMFCALADPNRSDGSRLDTFTLFTERMRMKSTESGARRTKPFKLTIARSDVEEVDYERAKDPQKRARQEAAQRRGEMKRELFEIRAIPAAPAMSGCDFRHLVSKTATGSIPAS